MGITFDLMQNNRSEIFKLTLLSALLVLYPESINEYDCLTYTQAKNAWPAPQTKLV